MDCLDVLLSIFHLRWGGWDQIISPAPDVVVKVDQGELVSSTQLTQYCLHGLDGLRRNLREDRFMLPAYESLFLAGDYRQIVTCGISTWALKSKLASAVQTSPFSFLHFLHNRTFHQRNTKKLQLGRIKPDVWLKQVTISLYPNFAALISPRKQSAKPYYCALKEIQIDLDDPQLMFV